MSKKETIEDQVKALSKREEKLKLQLSNDSDELKEKARHVGKIALIAGLVAIVGYWIFTIFSDDDEEEERPKKKKKKSKSASNGISSRLTALAIPYLEKFISGVMDDSDEQETSKKEKKKTAEIRED